MEQRKPNRIPEFDYSQTGAYFVTLCTQGRQKILSDIVGDGFPSQSLTESSQKICSETSRSNTPP